MRLIAKRRIQRKRAGEEFSVNAAIGRALVALGYARKPAEKQKQAKLLQPKQAPTYQRRDMTAEQPAPVPAPVQEYWTPPKP